MIEATVKDERLGYVGEITKVNVEPIRDLIGKNYIPVVSTLGYDKEGNLYNINADTAAAKIAGEMKAESLISMTDIAGILQDPEDLGTLLPVVDLVDAEELLQKGVISGGMIPKIRCCMDAIKEGVQKVFVLDGRVPHSILVEMLTDEGVGTMVIEKRKDR